MITLTDTQKQFALQMFQDDPNIINITKKLIGKPSLRIFNALNPRLVILGKK